MPDPHVALSITIDEGNVGFRHFWAKRVTGFDNSVHCAECLRGQRLPEVNTEFARGGLITLSMRPDSLVYICGVATPWNWSNNFHLALRVRTGSSCTSTFYTGARVEVTNGLAIPILDEAAKQLFPNLSADFLTCRNFQFGAQMFPARPSLNFDRDNSPVDDSKN